MINSTRGGRVRCAARARRLRTVQETITTATARTISTWYMHAASWLLERDILKGKVSPQFNNHAGWSVAFAKLACLRGFASSVWRQRGDCLILSCRRPR
jgi:hypothetical protein